MEYVYRHETANLKSYGLGDKRCPHNGSLCDIIWLTQDFPTIDNGVAAFGLLNVPGEIIPTMSSPTHSSVTPTDWRSFSSGLEIPSLYYVDQPYVVVTPQGAWVCVMTTGAAQEGAPRQFVASTTSHDCGRSWSDLVPIEAPDGPHAGWAVPFITPSGRIYAFYTFSGDEIHAGHNEQGEWFFWRHTRPEGIVFERNDSHGWYAFRYSDDGGQSWSPERYRLPLAETLCDQNRTCDTDERVQLFWGICRPFMADGKVYLPFSKLGKHFQQEGEGWLLRSDNLLTESDPDKIRWQMCPQGDHGIRNDQFGSVQEEHNVVPLRDQGHLFCMYRTIMGYPACSYSYDGGLSWTLPEAPRYSFSDRIMRNPRACPMVWRCQNGNYLFWFHNNGYRSYKNVSAPVARNLVWLSGGVEKDGKIHWSQPELIQYDEHDWRGSSYPDLIEQDGNYLVTSTQKTVARINQLDKHLVESLWKQDLSRSVTRRDILLDLDEQAIAADDSWTVEKLPRLDQQGGWSVDLWVRLTDLQPGRVLIDTTGGDETGITLRVGEHETLEISFHDGQHGFCWTSDPGTMGVDQSQHVVFIVDGGPKCVSVVVDGILCDGNGDEVRLRGTGRFMRTKYFDNYDDRCEPADEIGDVTGTGKLVIPSKSEVQRLRLYKRCLWVGEAMGNWRAGV